MLYASESLNGEQSEPAGVQLTSPTQFVFALFFGLHLFTSTFGFYWWQQTLLRHNSGSYTRSPDSSGFLFWMMNTARTTWWYGGLFPCYSGRVGGRLETLCVSFCPQLKEVYTPNLTSSQSHQWNWCDWEWFLLSALSVFVCLWICFFINVCILHVCVCLCVCVATDVKHYSICLCPVTLFWSDARRQARALLSVRRLNVMFCIIAFTPAVVHQGWTDYVYSPLSNKVFCAGSPKSCMLFLSNGALDIHNRRRVSSHSQLHLSSPPWWHLRRGS